MATDKKIVDLQTRKDRAHPESPPADAYEDLAEAQVFGLSDDDLALKFTERHASDLRYVAVWDRWLIWDCTRWAYDERRRVFDMARALCRDILAEHLQDPALTDVQRKSLRQRLGSAGTIWAVVKLAGSDPRHAVTVNQLDADPWALNTPGGTLDLRSGVMRPHEPNELHTLVTAATPEGDCPLFLSILERVQPEQAVRHYIRRLAGYALTGSSREHVLPFFFGVGRNGKGTIAHAIRRALGDYGLEVAPELLMESHNERHPTEIAVLRGARFVVGSEVDTGKRWNESRLKRLTGGDPISARYIGKDLFEFEPSHTLVVVGNSKPGLRSVDEAMRARVHLIEFGVIIPEHERDPTLAERLQPEYGGILKWALAGCLDWQAHGLAPPDSIRAATAQYLDGEDMISAWVTERCERCGQVTLAAAHKAFRQWCESSGAVVLGRNSFSDQLEAHGFKRQTDSHSKAIVFGGLGLKQSRDWRDEE